MILIKKGIDLPISGAITDFSIRSFVPQNTVAVVGSDYLGLKPTMFVAEGELVKKGQALFEDKKNPNVVVCAPVSGRIQSIKRGERRKPLSVIIEVQHDDEAVPFKSFSVNELQELPEDVIREQLRLSGQWVNIRQRPFDKIPRFDATTFAIFINAMDTNPLSFDPLLALSGREEDYQMGLAVISKLTAGNVHVCFKEGGALPAVENEKVKYHTFSGVHPAGLVGTHIHFIEPVGSQKTVWHLGLQDLLAIGHLFRTGTLDTQRIVAIAGPGVKKPELVRTVKGANLDELLEDNLLSGAQRIISGSVFSGRRSLVSCNYLGNYDQQISVLPEGRDSVFLEFMRLGENRYSKTRAYLGRFLKKPLPFTTAVQGSARAILPFGIYEEVMPLDILPTLLLKALVVKDTDTAVQLGALELVEEDVALLTYVDPGKHDFGAILRENLQQIEEES